LEYVGKKGDGNLAQKLEKLVIQVMKKSSEDVNCHKSLLLEIDEVHLH
jgi:hypothetical protein